MQLCNQNAGAESATGPAERRRLGRPTGRPDHSAESGLLLRLGAVLTGGEGGRSCSSMQMELLENVAHVGFDGPLAQDQFVGNGAIRFSFCAHRLSPPFLAR